MGESARRPGCPELPASPLELITPRPGEKYTPFQDHVWSAFGIIAGIATVTVTNILLRRPKWAGLPLHILGAGAGYLTFTWIEDKRLAARAENDAIIKHYITLHPEDFPPYERKRWRDVYKRFEPFR